VSSTDKDSLQYKFTNCVRLLSAEAIEKAKSGHPGLPMGAADIIYTLWQKYLKFNPRDTNWINRDRFILSAGHGSMLLYSMLHIYGYDLSLEDIKKFRQFKSRTPGHPEYGVTPGVETSTGPLGQGIANAVGMAIGYEMLRSRLSKNGISPLNHKIYVFCGDGDMMEGISYEAASLAGHLNLNNIVAIYDDNKITIEGSTELAFSEDVEGRFRSFGWDVVKIDGHDYAQIDGALKKASGNNDKPLLVMARTTIAKGSVNFEGSHKSHGAPLGGDEIGKIKDKMGVTGSESFCVSDEVREHAALRVAQLKKEYDSWTLDFAKFLKDNPDIDAFYRDFSKKREIDIKDLLNTDFGTGKIATRSASGLVMQKIAKLNPSLVGGSADLGPSNNTYLKDFKSFSRAERTGRNLHFGVREHAMGAVANGLALYSEFTPYGATFLIFSDYMKPAIRLAALMKLHVIYILTHDSFYVGEDGPTHQPIEQIWGLRSVPGLDVIRPADAAETAAAWAQAMNNGANPAALILTRQNVSQIDRSKYASADGLLKGAYIISPESGKALELIIIATGSEVSAALEVQSRLKGEGVSARVVSAPSLEIFERQDEKYKESVIPKNCIKRVSIEAGSSGGWHKYVGCDGLVIGIDHFGASAPAEELCDVYGFTPEKLYQSVNNWLKK